MATYGYARVSTAAQADRGDGLEVQRQKIRGRAAMDGWPVDRVFVERNVSGGRPLAERPQGRALLDALRPGDRVICAKLDRMFRNAADACAMLAGFRRRGVALHLLDLGGDDCTADGIAGLVFTILSAVAEFERGRIAERIAEAKAEQRARRLFTGGAAPFGYTVGEDSGLVEEPGARAIIARAVQLRAAGASLRAISGTIEAETGRRVSHVTVRRLLRDHGADADRAAASTTVLARLYPAAG